VAPSRRAARPLLDDQLAGFLAAARDADSVELKLTVPESNQRSAVEALDMDPLQGQIRQIFFFDTPGLALERSGIVLRARRVQGQEDDTTIKLRPVVPGDLPARLRRSRDFTVEVDAMPGGYVCSASLGGLLASTEVKDAAAGRRPVRSLFTRRQRAFFRDHAPAGLGIDDLAVLGPVNVLKLKLSPKGGRRMVAELWFYPDGSRALELSTKCAPAEALDVALASRDFLVERAIEISGDQRTKTRTALQILARDAASRR
jgi:hypothetical protein